jgi:NAD(P)-dependent dehydrogenase (short-subunit alcohol dehydrogenase family)
MRRKRPGTFAMHKTIQRRTLLQASVAAAMTAALPRSLFAGNVAFEDIPRSEFGFDTTCDDVCAGHDLSGKVILITGCNSGLGYESMRVLAAHGAHVIGAGRTQDKAAQACESVEGKTTPVVCELTDMDSVAACAGAVKALGKPVDVLMCNAGVMALPKLEQVDVNGQMLERQFVINHLGHFLLTRLLLDDVQAAPAGRIVTVSSGGYTLAPKGGIQFDNLSGEAGYQPFKAYGQTKLANILMTNEITTRYGGGDTTMTANSTHPGIVATNLGRYMRGGKPRDPDEPLRKGMKTPAQGAATQVYVAIDPRLDGVSGYYFGDCNPEETKGAYANDPELAARLWDVSEELVARWIA